LLVRWGGIMTLAEELVSLLRENPEGLTFGQMFTRLAGSHTRGAAQACLIWLETSGWIQVDRDATVDLYYAVPARNLAWAALRY